MKNIFKSIFVVLLASFLVGCDDFEDDVVFQIDSSSTKNAECEVLGAVGQNALKVKVTTYINVTEQKNVTIERADIHLDYFKEYVSQASVEKVSDGLYKCTAIFESIPMPSFSYEMYSVWTNVKGNYLDARVGANSITIAKSMLVGIDAVQQLFAAPDTVAFAVKLNKSEYLDYGDHLQLQVKLFYEKEDTARFTESPVIKPGGILGDGIAIFGFRLAGDRNYKSGNYRAKVYLNNSQKECSTVIPKSTATFKNVEAYVDVTGLHVKGDFDKGNLCCDPYLVISNNSDANDNYIRIPRETKNINVICGYPPYNTNYAIKTRLETMGCLDLGISNSFTVRSNYSRYGVDMGGDVLWATENATNPNWWRSEYANSYNKNVGDGEGDWRIPTDDEALFLGRNSKWTWDKSYPGGMNFTSNITGRSVFIPAKGLGQYQYYYSAYYTLQSSGVEGMIWLESGHLYHVYNGSARVISPTANYLYSVRYVLPKSKADIK